MSLAADFSQILDAKLECFDSPPAKKGPGPFFAPDPGLRFALWGGGLYARGPQQAYKRAARWGADRAADGAPPGRTTAEANGSQGRDSAVPPAENADGRSSRAHQAPAGERASRARGDRGPLRGTLSPRQRVALATLRRIGAVELDATSSRSEVRRAFRALALRYHPDRHLEAPPAERARLAALFADASQAYRTLMAS